MNKINIPHSISILVIGILLIGSFVFIQNKFDERQQAVLYKNNEEEKKKEDKASEERNQIDANIADVRADNARIEGKLDVNIRETKGVRTDLNTSLNNLNKFKNEKESVNVTNTTADQQYNYLKSAKYEPY